MARGAARRRRRRSARGACRCIAPHRALRAHNTAAAARAASAAAAVAAAAALRRAASVCAAQLAMRCGMCVCVCAAHFVFRVLVRSAALAQQCDDGRVTVTCGPVQRRPAILRAHSAAQHMATRREREGEESALRGGAGGADTRGWRCGGGGAIFSEGGGGGAAPCQVRAPPLPKAARGKPRCAARDSRRVRIATQRAAQSPKPKHNVIVDSIAHRCCRRALLSARSWLCAAARACAAHVVFGVLVRSALPQQHCDGCVTAT
jgi:hypothetical protein